MKKSKFMSIVTQKRREPQLKKARIIICCHSKGWRRQDRYSYKYECRTT